MPSPAAAVWTAGAPPQEPPPLTLQPASPDAALPPVMLAVPGVPSYYAVAFLGWSGADCTGGERPPGYLEAKLRTVVRELWGPHALVSCPLPLSCPCCCTASHPLCAGANSTAYFTNFTSDSGKQGSALPAGTAGPSAALPVAPKVGSRLLSGMRPAGGQRWEPVHAPQSSMRCNAAGLQLACPSHPAVLCCLLQWKSSMRPSSPAPFRPRWAALRSAWAASLQDPGLSQRPLAESGLCVGPLGAGRIAVRLEGVSVVA